MRCLVRVALGALVIFFVLWWLLGLAKSAAIPA